MGSGLVSWGAVEKAGGSTDVGGSGGMKQPGTAGAGVAAWDRDEPV